LGASLWPIQLFLLQWTRLTTEQAERLGQVAEQIRQAREGLGLGMLALVVVPAILEEMFFRGLLFNALKRQSGPVVTIGTTALLFGVTHVVIGGALGLDRLLPSAALGLVLGWVRWQTGSLWPSVVQHVCHNTLLALLQTSLEPGQLEHIPLDWLLAALGGTGVGGVLVWLSGPRRSSARH
jgi:membrane protease YdiL (CAAX protease family)